MSDTALRHPDQRHAHRWRAVAFRVVVVGLIAILLIAMNGAQQLLAPWYVFPDSVDHGYPRPPELHRMADAQSAALFALLFAGSLAGLVRRPAARPALLQLWVIAFGGIAFFGLTGVGNRDKPDPLPTLLLTTAIVVAVLVVLPALLHPARRTLLDFEPAQPSGGVVTAVAAAGAIGVLGWMVSVIGWHAAGHYIEAPVEEDWLSALYLGFALLVALGLIALRRPGWGWLAGAVAVTAVYTGLISLVLPDSPLGWGTVGGVLGIALGLTLAVAATSAIRPRLLGRRPIAASA